MAAQAFDNFTLLMQINGAARDLAKNMRRNAQEHLNMVAAQNPDVVKLTAFVRDCASSYQVRINAVKNWVQANNAQASAAVGLIGATLADLNAYTLPLQSATTALAAADLSSYAAITAACNAVLATVPDPQSVWGW